MRAVREEIRQRNNFGRGARIRSPLTKKQDATLKSEETLALSLPKFGTNNGTNRLKHLQYKNEAYFLTQLPILRNRGTVPSVVKIAVLHSQIQKVVICGCFKKKKRRGYISSEERIKDKKMNSSNQKHVGERVMSLILHKSTYLL